MIKWLRIRVQCDGTLKTDDGITIKTEAKLFDTAGVVGQY